MISYKLQIILIIASSCTFIILINMIKKYELELKYSMLWIFLSLSTLVLSIFPKVFYVISDVMGIELPVNALFLTSIIGCLIILFSITLILSKATNKIKDLSQELGVLKLELDEIKKLIDNESRWLDESSLNNH